MTNQCNSHYVVWGKRVKNSFKCDVCILKRDLKLNSHTNTNSTRMEVVVHALWWLIGLAFLKRCRVVQAAKIHLNLMLDCKSADVFPQHMLSFLKAPDPNPQPPVLKTSHNDHRSPNDSKLSRLSYQAWLHTSLTCLNMTFLKNSLQRKSRRQVPSCIVNGRSGARTKSI